eukprot:254643_1
MKTCGEYIWNINDSHLMNKLTTCKIGECIISDSFYLAQLPFKIILYPNEVIPIEDLGWRKTLKLKDQIYVNDGGKWHTGEVVGYDGTQVKIHYVGYAVKYDEWIQINSNRLANTSNIGTVKCGLKLFKIPDSWESIFGAITIECVETRTKERKLIQFTKYKNVQFWSDGPLQRKGLLKLKQVTFVVSFNVFRILLNDNKLFYEPKLNVNYPKNTSIEWKIDNELSHKMRNCDQERQIFTSKIYNNMWYLCVSPNGFCDGIKGDVILELCLYTLPKHISKLRVHMKLYCPGAYVTDNKIVEFSYKECETKHGWKSNTFSLQHFKVYENIVFYADIIILAVYDMSGAAVYDMSDKIEKDWSTFINNDY